MVSREGSDARASEVLHVTPATISIQLRDLEKTLGEELFRKSGRGLALTELGTAVQAYAQDIFSTGQELLDMVKGRPVGGPMVLRVGIKDVLPKLVAYQLLLRRSLDYWFEESEIRPKIVGEFDDSAMLKIMGSAGVGVFPVAKIILKEVEAMYGVEFIGTIANLSEKFYALSVAAKGKASCRSCDIRSCEKEVGVK